MQLPRIGRIHTHERLDTLVDAIDTGHARIIRATVSYSRGRWWCSFTISDTRTVAAQPRKHRVVGVDAGVVDLPVATTEDGTLVDRVPAPKPLADAQGNLRDLQRRAARQTRGSGRWHATMRRWPCPAQAGQAGGCETSTQHRPPPDQTGTAARQRAAA